MQVVYSKTPLSFDEYQEYEIDQRYLAFKVEFKNIGLDRCDELELELQQQGNKIFHIKTDRYEQNYNVTFVVGQSKPTF